MKYGFNRSINQSTNLFAMINLCLWIERYSNGELTIRRWGLDDHFISSSADVARLYIIDATGSAETLLLLKYGQLISKLVTSDTSLPIVNFETTKKYANGDIVFCLERKIFYIGAADEIASVLNNYIGDNKHEI